MEKREVSSLFYAPEINRDKQIEAQREKREHKMSSENSHGVGCAEEPRDGYAETTHIVMTEDTNELGNLHGGTLMHWVDIVGAVAAMRHTRSIVTTAALDGMDFKLPAALGSIVTLKAYVTWTGNTSLEVRVDVYNEKAISKKKVRTNTAYLVFVALDYDERPKPVPPFVPQTPGEKEEYEHAVLRREERIRRKKGQY